IQAAKQLEETDHAEDLERDLVPRWPARQRAAWCQPERRRRPDLPPRPHRRPAPRDRGRDHAGHARTSARRRLGAQSNSRIAAAHPGGGRLKRRPRAAFDYRVGASTLAPRLAASAIARSTASTSRTAPVSAEVAIAA